MMSDNLIPPPERDFPETQLRLRKDQLLAAIQTGRRRRPRMPRRRALVVAFSAPAAAAKSGEAALQWDLAPRTSNDWSAPNCMTYGQDTDWSKYSSDPQTLLQQIDTLWNKPDASPAEEFDYIEQTLGQSNPPPDVI